MNKYNPSRDVLPIIAIHSQGPYRLKGFTGTGFLIAKNVLVTCYHCVSPAIGEDYAYAVAFPKEYYDGPIKNDAPDIPYVVARLHGIQQHPDGLDLAIAEVRFEPERLTLGTRSDIGYGTEVSTFGYPLTRDLPNPETGRSITFKPRYLRGYISRGFSNDVPGYGPTETYEIDMPAPAGISGAPVIKRGTSEVIGVVYGTEDTGIAEEGTGIEGETGERVPRVRRWTTFTLAHELSSLQSLRGTYFTEYMTLSDYVRTTGPQPAPPSSP
jgi:hypothetical protein